MGVVRPANELLEESLILRFQTVVFGFEPGDAVQCDLQLWRSRTDLFGTSIGSQVLLAKGEGLPDAFMPVQCLACVMCIHPLLDSLDERLPAKLAPPAIKNPYNLGDLLIAEIFRSRPVHWLPLPP